MILGIGTDLTPVARIEAAIARHGDRFAERILSPLEQQAFTSQPPSAAQLAKRYAAKEALSKALGTGISGAMNWHAASVAHHAAGGPYWVLSPELLASLVCGVPLANCQVHLSLSDDAGLALAFVVIESLS